MAKINEGQIMNNPLNMPEGSVRAIIALVIIGSSMIYIFVYRDMPEGLGGLCSLIVGFYFWSRSKEPPAIPPEK